MKGNSKQEAASRRKFLRDTAAVGAGAAAIAAEAALGAVLRGADHRLVPVDGRAGRRDQLPVAIGVAHRVAGKNLQGGRGRQRNAAVAAPRHAGGQRQRGADNILNRKQLQADRSADNIDNCIDAADFVEMNFLQ